MFLLFFQTFVRSQTMAPSPIVVPSSQAPASAPSLETPTLWLSSPSPVSVSTRTTPEPSWPDLPDIPDIPDYNPNTRPATFPNKRPVPNVPALRPVKAPDRVYQVKPPPRVSKGAMAAIISCIGFIGACALGITKRQQQGSESSSD